MKAKTEISGLVNTRNRRRPSTHLPKQQEMGVFRSLEADLFLANQLFRYGAPSTIYPAVSTSAERKAAIRREILARDIANRPTLDHRQKALNETLGAAFLRLYHEAL